MFLNCVAAPATSAFLCTVWPGLSCACSLGAFENLSQTMALDRSPHEWRERPTRASAIARRAGPANAPAQTATAPVLRPRRPAPVLLQSAKRVARAPKIAVAHHKPVHAIALLPARDARKVPISAKPQGLAEYSRPSVLEFPGLPSMRPAHSLASRSTCGVPRLRESR